MYRWPSDALATILFTWNIKMLLVEHRTSWDQRSGYLATDRTLHSCNKEIRLYSTNSLELCANIALVCGISFPFHFFWVSLWLNSSFQKGLFLWWKRKISNWEGNCSTPSDALCWNQPFQTSFFPSNSLATPNSLVCSDFPWMLQCSLKRQLYSSVWLVF